MRSKQLLFGVVTVCLFTRVVGAQISGVTYRRVLLPVVVERPVPGAAGSLWQTDLGLTNEGSSPMWLFPIQFLGVLCEPVVCASPNTRLSAGLTIPGHVYYFDTPNSFFGPGSPPTNGVVLHAEDQYADSLRISLRVHDLSRQDKSWGATIPVVPENRFVQSVTLPGLPGENSNFRVNIRIYSLEIDVPVQVDMQAFATNPNQFDDETARDASLGTKRFSLNTPTTAEIRVGNQRSGSSSSYVSISDLQSITGGTTAPLYRLEITSATTGVPIWAFASVTNNETQEVTVIGPADH